MLSWDSEGERKGQAGGGGRGEQLLNYSLLSAESFQDEGNPWRTVKGREGEGGGSESAAAVGMCFMGPEHPRGPRAQPSMGWIQTEPKNSTPLNPYSPQIQPGLCIKEIHFPPYPRPPSARPPPPLLAHEPI